MEEGSKGALLSWQKHTKCAEMTLCLHLEVSLVMLIFLWSEK